MRVRAVAASQMSGWVWVPADFDLTKTKGLGMRLLRAFQQQLEATITVNPQASGTEFIVTIPLSAKP